MPTTLTLAETVDLAQKVLDENKIAPSSKRASVTLSQRSVRWYTTVGVLDAPGRIGHTAVYGRRHLLQLLYTRQAQSDGTPLDQIQKVTTLLSDQDLTARINLDLSLVPDDLTTVAPHQTSQFWDRTPSDTPNPPSPATTIHVARLSDTPPLPASLTRSTSSLQATVEYVVHVGPLVVILDHDPTQAELDSITQESKSLLASLKDSSSLPFINSFPPPSVAPSTPTTNNNNRSTK